MFNPRTLKILVPIFVFSGLAMVFFLPSKEEIGISILFRLLSGVFALAMVLKFKEWRLVFLPLFFFLMTIRQTCTLLIWLKVLENNEFMKNLSEIPGFLVTVLSLVSVVYLGLVLNGKVDLIRQQKIRIHSLERFLPICSGCKKIRNKDGAWNILEAYIEKNTGSKFSHGLCPDCFQKMSDELDQVQIPFS